MQQYDMKVTREIFRKYEIKQFNASLHAGIF